MTDPFAVTAEDHTMPGPDNSPSIADVLQTVMHLVIADEHGEKLDLGRVSLPHGMTRQQTEDWARIYYVPTFVAPHRQSLFEANRLCAGITPEAIERHRRNLL